MSQESVAPRLGQHDPLALQLVGAIHGGDLDELRRLLAEHPELARVRIEGRNGGSRTAMHVVADWPGYFRNGPAVVELLLQAGSHPDGPPEAGPPQETPLHWAASSDDVEVARALIEGGADIEAPGASIAGGPPLDDAVGYGCWRVARLLVERGARVDKLWHAAGLGMLARVKELMADDPPSQEDLNGAFWQACHGGHRRVAEYLLERGAELNAPPSWSDATPLDIATSDGTGREALVTWLRDKGAISTRPPS